MILSGKEIQRQVELGNIVISGFDHNKLNPNSYNVTLHDELMVYNEVKLDMKKEPRTRRFKIPPEGLTLYPGELYLARTNEWTDTEGLVPMLEGRSSIGRLGMFIHVTAGFGDVGFKGFWTLEIAVIKPLKIYPNVEIGQLYYHTIEGDQAIKYEGGKYFNNFDIQASKLSQDFKED